MNLPPIGTPLTDDVQRQILATIQLRKEEARLVRATYEEWADLCSNYYHYGAADPPPDDIIVIHDIQNAVITQTDIQTKEPPSINLEPVDTEEPPRYFHNLPPPIAAQIGLQPNEYQPTADPTGQVVPPAPLSPPSVMLLRNAIMAGLLPPEVLIEVSVTETADFYQKIFDVIWQRSAPEEWFEENTLWNNVYGWQPTSYEFDDEKKAHILTNMPLRHVFMDPTASTVEKAAYVIFDIPYDAEVAKGLYPQFADEIEQHADQTGKITRPPSTLQMGSQFEDVPNFQRPMITLTVAFLRDQECMHTPESAIDDVQIHKKKVGTGTWMPAATPDGDMQEQEREGLFHAENGQEVFPPDHAQHDPAQWPTYRCLRQITTIATKSVVLDDAECKYWDIPAALNVCIPILGKPFGIGEPFRLKSMQDGRTRIMNGVVDHADYFMHPISELPLEAREQLPEEYKDGHMHPGMVVWVPGDLLAKHPNGVARFVNPAPLPPALMEVDDKLKREVNDSSGNMAALQGQPAEQISQLSGVAIGMIQSGASSMASFKARRVQSVVKRLARLALHSILTRMTPADIVKIIKKYPVHVVEAMHAQAQDLEWSVQVSVSSGAGATMDKKKAEAKDNFKLQLISRKTAQERIGEDAQLEDQRMKEEMAEQAQLQAQLQPAEPAENGGTGKDQARGGPTR